MAETFNIERVPEPRPREIQNAQFISLWVGRLICQATDSDFMAMQRYQWQLAKSNDGLYKHTEGHTAMRTERSYLDEESTVVMPVDKLHITHIEAGFIGQLLVQKFARDDGRFIKPQAVKRLVFRAAKYYRQDAAAHADKQQDELLYGLGRQPERRGKILEEEFQHEGLNMNAGQFATIDHLGAFGIDNKFGLRFSREARQFLTAERDRALDIVTGSLGIDIDREIDSHMRGRFYGREPHVTLIEFGKESEQAPHWRVNYPENHDAILPKTFVTELDPKASVIIRDAD